MTDAARAPRPELIVRALPLGAAVILRDYEAPGRAALAARLAAIARRRGVRFLVGADIALARAVDADGVHLPSWASWPDDTGGLMVSCACHNAEDLDRAARRGANVAFLSPVFPTESHRGAEALGPQKFKALAARAKLPVLALGGVDKRNARAIAAPNVAGLAAIGAFLPG